MIKIIAPGKIKDKHMAALIDDYVKRINHYHKLEIVEVKDETISANNSDDHIKQKEAERILNKIAPSDYVVCLDLNGKMMDSIEFSQAIEKLTERSCDTDFIIGGSLGIHECVLERSNATLKLSPMTFLHQMTRLILLEQIYRAFKILHHETYHK